MTRLINADDMIKSLMDMTFYDEEGHTIDDYEDRLAIVKSFVDSVPTVEAQPVRHGRWDYVTVVDEGFWRCSNCGTPSEALGAKVLYKYCPFCGAKMGENHE